jgi:hypothetical protein
MKYSNLVVTILPSRDVTPGTDASRTVRQAEARKESARTYLALIYTDLPDFTWPSRPEPPPSQPSKVGGYPLAAVESLRLHWDKYQEYLAKFLQERKSPRDMSERLFDAMSPGLERLFGSVVQASRPIRVWWNVEATELEDFPWELVAYMQKQAMEISHFSFVRGKPPETLPPQVPLDGPLRLGIVAEAATNTQPLESAVSGISNLQVFRLSTPPREALAQAARQQFELVHIVSDGIVSLACDGVLYFHDAAEPELPAEEIAAILRTSRTVFLGFTSTSVLNPDVVQIGGREVPSAYRAFAYLGSADLPLPTVLTPLAPIDFGLIQQFWRTFYTALASTLSIEMAVAEGRNGEPLPIALYLRHPHERQFREPRGATFGELGFAPAPSAPAEVGAELDVSQTLVERLQKISAHSTWKSAAVDEFLRDEGAHQQRLKSQLAAWGEDEE